VELDVGELRDPVDGQEHHQLAVGMAQLAAVDVHVADLVGLESPALLLGLFDRQSGDAMTLEATMQGTAAEVRDGVSQAAQHIVKWQKCRLPECHDDGFLRPASTLCSWAPWGQSAHRLS